LADFVSRSASRSFTPTEGGERHRQRFCGSVVQLRAEEHIQGLVYNTREQVRSCERQGHMQPKATPQAPAQTLEHVIAILSAHRDELASRYHLRSLGIFGSYVRGEQRPESDIDVLADFTVTPSLFMLTALEDELTALLGAPVDLAVKSALRPHIGARILSEVLTI
jgi:predicted nucleotidyltransferase